MRFSVTLLALPFLAGCTPSSDGRQMQLGRAESSLRTLQATGPTVEITVRDQAPVAWVVSPETDPDVFSFVCDRENPTTVEYSSDAGSLQFEVKGLDRKTFSIISADGRLAKNELRCLPPPARYRSSYDAARRSAGVYPDDLEPLVETYFEDGKPGVLVGVWKDGEEVYSRAIGLANVERGRQRTVADPFEIASLSKEFTAVAVMQLVEKELIDLDAPVATFYPELPWGQTVTIGHLLSHTSGLGNRTYTGEYTRKSAFDREKALKQLSLSTPDFEPGEAYQYSNAGMTLLALITEKVTGVPRAEYLTENILLPAGMSETRLLWQLTPEEIERYSAGYNVSAGEVTRLPMNMHPTASFGSGDLISTLTDIRRWHVALRENRLISDASFDLMIEPVRLPDGSVSERGLAFMVGSVAGQKLIYNSGDISTHTRHAFFADRDISVIVNTNADIDGNFDIGGRVRDQIIGKLMNTHSMELYSTTIDVRGDY